MGIIWGSYTADVCIILRLMWLLNLIALLFEK